MIKSVIKSSTLLRLGEKAVCPRLVGRWEQDFRSLLHSSAPSILQFSMSTSFQHIYREEPSLFLFQLIPASGLKKSADRAKARKTIPPMIVTKRGKIRNAIRRWTNNLTCCRYVFKPSPVLTDIFWAIILPPITASPVHRQCPSVPPTATPKGSWEMRGKQKLLILCMKINSASVVWKRYTKDLLGVEATQG